MQRFNLREAARLTSRSVTTLRRYVRSGRLGADKQPGRFGPEYFVTEDGLARAGLTVAPGATASPALPVARRRAEPPAGPALERVLRESVPLGLYQELLMKHEQLLVQYGMVRAGGLRWPEGSGDGATGPDAGGHPRAELARLQERMDRQSADLRRQLRKAHLELEGRALQIAALREKVRALEMLTRNASTSESIERQFREVATQAREVQQMSGRLAGPPAGEEPGPEH